MTKKRILFITLILISACAAAYFFCAQKEPVRTDFARTPQEIFLSLKGSRAVTNGWADMHNNGLGLTYASPAALTLIDGHTFPSALEKRLALTTALAGDEEKFIIISGDIDLSDGLVTDTDHSHFDRFDPATGARMSEDIVFSIGSNTTLIGINCARLMYGGFKIEGKQNIIIRNITFYDAHGSTEKDIKKDKHSKASIDAIEISAGSSGVWVDGCKFTDGVCEDKKRNINHDGLLDISSGVNITVSYNEFTNHDKVMLIGSDDTALNSLERTLTLHHNYFHGAVQRMPRTRGAKVHIYNNYYKPYMHDGFVTGYFLGPGVNAELIVEKNFFELDFTSRPFRWWDNEMYPSRVYYTGNKTIDNNTHWYNRTFASKKPFAVPYAYKARRAKALPQLIASQAGPGCGS